MFNNYPPPKLCPLCDNVGKYGRARQATDDNIIRRMYIACRVTKAKIQTHTHNISCFLLFDGNNDYSNALYCCVMRTLLVLFALFVDILIINSTILLGRFKGYNFYCVQCLESLDLKT
jgi:hypothetical protein